MVAIHKKKGRVYLTIYIAGLIGQAGFLLRTQLMNLHLRSRPVVSTYHFSRILYSLPWLHTTLPDSSLPPDWRAEEHTWTLLTLPKTHPGRGYRLDGELGSLAMWHSCFGVRQSCGGYLSGGNRLICDYFFWFVLWRDIISSHVLMGSLPHPPYGTS